MKQIAVVGFLGIGLAACVTDDGVSDAPPLPPRIDCDLQSETYRIERVAVPMLAEDAVAPAFDLDGGGEVDNATGGLLAALLNGYVEGGAPVVEDQVARRAASGELTWLIEVARCEEGDDTYAEVWLARGVDLDGDGQPAIDHRIPRRPAIGTLIDGRLDAVAGQGEAPISALFDPLGAVPLAWSAGDGLAVELELGADGLWRGRVGLAFPGGIAAAISRPIAAFLASDQGQEWSWFFDQDGDGVSDPMEIERSNIISSTAGNPDLDLLSEHDGRQVYWPHRDGVKDSLSYAAFVEAI